MNTADDIAHEIHQPKGLYFLFVVELWERYAYYTLNGLFVLYLTQSLLFSDKKAYGLFATYSALIWLTPSVGGFLADKLLGFRHILIMGGIMLTLGYALLAIPNQHLFYIALSLLLFGNGFFKPCVEGLLGSLYHGPRDPRRDGGFTIYYMGINIGAMLGPVISGFLAQIYGWRIGFLSASLGMLVGLIIFIAYRHTLGNKGLKPQHSIGKRKILPYLPNNITMTLGLLALLYCGTWLLSHMGASNIAVVLLGAMIVIAYIITAFKQAHSDRNRMIGCLVLVLFSIAFWVLYQQAPMSVNLFTERNVNRVVLGYTIPTVWFQSLNPIFIVILTPFMNIFWGAVGRRDWILPTAVKFVAGILLMGLGFLVLNVAADSTSTGIVSSSWVVASYFLQSTGELALSPIGLSMMTGMAPKNLGGMMIGTWYLASAASNALAGVAANMASVPDTDMSSMASASIYGHAFGLYGWTSIGVGIIALFFVPWLRRMMEEVKK